MLLSWSTSMHVKIKVHIQAGYSCSHIQVSLLDVCFTMRYAHYNRMFVSCHMFIPKIGIQSSSSRWDQSSYLICHLPQILTFSNGHRYYSHDRNM